MTTKLQKLKRLGTRTAVAVACSAWLGLFGCSKATVVSRESLGMLVDAQVVPTSFNEAPKMQIRTTGAVVVIIGFAAVPIGHEAFRVEFSDGRNRIAWDGKIQGAIY